MNLANSSAGTTAGVTLSPVAELTASTACRLNGSLIANTSDPRCIHNGKIWNR